MAGEDKLDKVRKIINLYGQKRETYNQIARFMENKLLPKLFPDAQKCSARSKTPPSLAGKVLKKHLRNNVPAQDVLAELTDLVGARVIFLRRDQVDEAHEKVYEFFTVDDRNSQNTAERLNDREFGYLSRHYIIRVDADLKNKAEEKLSLNFPDFEEPFFMELQIRTWLQHVWAELSHDSIYKCDRVIPRELIRSWSALAAILENADEKIMDCLNELERHTKNRPYYNEDDLQQKISTLEIVISIQCDDLEKRHSSETGYAEKIKALEKNRNELTHLYGIGDKRNEILLDRIDRFTQSKNETVNDAADPKELLLKLKNDDSICKLPDELLFPLLEIVLRRCEDMIKSAADLPWAFAGKIFSMMLLLRSVNLQDASEREKFEKSSAEIYDTVLRLIDLCNEHSVANLGSGRHIATKASREALETIINIIKKHKTQFEKLDKNTSDTLKQAPLTECVEKMLELGCFAHTDISQKQSAPEKDSAVIIAGGCNLFEKTKENETALQDFKALFAAALKGNKKIRFYTGYGSAGICTLFDDITENNYEVSRFGIAGDPEESFPSQYKKHSVWEALMQWDKLREEGYRFADVALVGFGLGTISRLECRMALAFGARVTVIKHKNFLSYEQTFEGIPYWSDHPSLVHLPLIRKNKPANLSIEQGSERHKECLRLQQCGFPEAMMLRVFMLFSPYHENDYNNDSEKYKLAVLIHRIKQLRTALNKQDLTDLTDVKKLSAQHRLLMFDKLYEDSHEKLPTLTLPPENDGIGKEWLDKCHIEAKKEVEPAHADFDFGEREHARWYIERWLQGTRYGINKIDCDVPKESIKNPCMVAWFDLDDDTILKDTDFISRYLVAYHINDDNGNAAQAIDKTFTQKS